VGHGNGKKGGLGDFGDFELRLYIGKDGVSGEVGHPWNVSGGIGEVFLGKGVVRAGCGCRADFGESANQFFNEGG